MATTSETSRSRRSFLLTTGAAAGGLALLPRFASGYHQSTNETIRVGLVGCGGRGLGAAMDALNSNPDVKIVALADLFPDAMERGAAQLKKSEHGARIDLPPERLYVGFDSYKKLIESDVEVVLLCAPPHYRPDHMEAAVAAGKHIFCEKPIAVDATGVRRVLKSVEDAKAKQLNVVSGLCWRYDDGVRETVKRVMDGQIGPIVSTIANYLATPIWVRNRKPHMTDMEYQCHNWYYFVWLSGDHFVEQFIHSLDKAMWLRGDVPPIRCVGQGGRQMRDESQGDIYDHFSVVYEWADGTVTHASTRQFANTFTETEDHILGTKGKAKLIAHEITGANPWKFSPSAEPLSMYEAEHKALYEAVRGQRETINNGPYMCNSTMMAIMGREACYSGQDITWNEALQSTQDLRPPSYQFDVAPPDSFVRLPGEYSMPGSKDDDA
jgi:myo-inositol 2-dehydrogenase / D-chiro-inositol 1-dehydrogenase